MSTILQTTDSASQVYALEITCPLGLENVLEKELHDEGLTQTRFGEGQVKLTTDLEGMYKACLWSRVATRVMLPIANFKIDSADELYDGVKAIKWSDHMSASDTIAIDCHGTNHHIRNTQFGAVRAKDAIADYFVELSGERPNVQKEQPDVRIALRIKREVVTVSIDLSGESMHRRGYRQQGSMAPLKENLAAGLLMRAGWGRDCGLTQLIDPMCGSATFLVEAAMMSLDIAPGLGRQYWGFKGWKQHDHRMWQQLMDFAKNRKKDPAELGLRFQGTDRDQRAIAAARESIKRAGMVGVIDVAMTPFQEHEFDINPELPGLVITNPPYGERMGDEMALIALYRQLGEWVVSHVRGWQFMMLTSNDHLARQIPARPEKSTRVINGGIECRAYIFPLLEGRIKEDVVAQSVMTPGAQMFANRLQKNVKKMKKWVDSNKIQCYRVYDADMPEYAVAIDIYQDWAHVQEYQAPKSVDPEKAKQRLFEVMSAIPTALNIAESNVILKQRQRQSGKEQYEKLDQSKHEMIVEEYGCDFIVNLKDYLDTGLFLDHRPVRKLIQDRANGKRFLNLFCYTATASVHAGQGGARSSLSVDMSNTYTEWARRNIELNEFSERNHQVERADCIEWLKQSRDVFDLIFMDPPTFSNSKKMADVLDIQRDHGDLLRLAMARLAKGGELIFSNNYRRFILDADLEQEFEVKNITHETFDPDFDRNSKIHQCYVIKHKS
ncbi:bifunctional 23S rRNA (guanine(2069)-N(7))-methyltransferase RlmK/23S rRNA (guanine(2445)-N(2))-methyltransferase RlmL [Marinomonas primoryensis]|jgi:23S rRNA (guanine2445-N2)-methyltransferase / 23S rRNA (guanine2069-N7)-methyltransferase|uniref:Ribosomal RNA large subunit methyltransferase K/L n=1 Tax=Marinomonas primoryensis TaxID=178399 RepID=A0A859D2I5_9GAMM|nr:bifunctional 23S rRNA (guanine(2069)-N(7))-methyltransferase RlmK/23S rRNA (guanine(2445)-N(2))-methyltransferase RlmL [Marinomonas primoryensis]QKK81061.1 23S rRNA (guanine(2445)-N(2))-methyltransferase [Marinomonas primoryensis]|tara:strand:- start:61739 stop:63907 length:2169 start_codon:yes stop_codon:yes gene_type:complete